MGKAILILVLVFVVVIGFIVYRSYSTATGKDPLAAGAKTGDKKDTKTGEGPNVFDRAGQIAEDTVRKGSQEVKEALKTKLNLTVAPLPVEIEKGKKAEARIMRGTSDLPALALKLEPAANAGLKASGGNFAAGQKETTLTIEADANAKSQDTMVTLRFEDYALPVPVRIK